MAVLEPALAVGGGVLKLLRPIAGPLIIGAAGFAAGVAYEHKAPWGPFPRLHRAEAAASAWKASQASTAALARAWAGAAGQSEALRRQEADQATRAVSAAESACAAQVAAARRSAAAIQSIVTKEPAHDANGCPLRELVDPGRLRDALGVPAGPG